MPIAVTDTQRALAAAIRDWAQRVRPVDAARAAETPAAQPAGWPEWQRLAEIGVFGVAVPEDLGGAGGSVADAAVGVEQAAAALVPGPVLPTVLAALVLGRTPDAAVAKELVPALVAGRATAAVGSGTATAQPAPDGGLLVNGDAGLALGAGPGTQLLLSAGERWFVIPAETPGVRLEQITPLDFSTQLARVQLADVTVPESAVLEAADLRDLTATLAAAEAAGVAAWCLQTASDYAKTREQFGRRIGEFQAVKHLCAGMLVRAEKASALAWDAARAADDGPEQLSIAAATAAAVALDAAVDNAKDCIQVLGGIGFTWEHDAHLYLRRAVALRQLLGGGSRWRTRAAELTAAGVRRQVRVDTGEEQCELDRDQVRADVAAIAQLPPADQRKRLAETGYLVPHWPKPYGLAASVPAQFLIDAELAAAGLQRPKMPIDSWAAATLVEHGSDEQRERYLPPTLNGELTWCQLFSEPEAGSDLAALRTKAVRADGGWLLTGQKVWTSNAQGADRAICLARTDPDAPKHKGITYFLLDMRADGVEIRPLREITGQARFNEVFLTDVFVPDADVVGEVNGGWPLARTTLANERVAMSTGSALGDHLERLVDQQPADTDRLGGLIADAAACAVLDARAVLNQLAGRAGPESSVAKLVGVAHRQEVAEAALELLGPAGAADDDHTGAVLHEFLISRCLSIAGGTTQVLLNVAAERLLGLPRG